MGLRIYQRFHPYQLEREHINGDLYQREVRRPLPQAKAPSLWMVGRQRVVAGPVVRLW